FQAEDGIRDFHVTGVQTCALPISLPPGQKPAEDTSWLYASRVTSSGRWGIPPGWSGARRPENRVTARSNDPQKRWTGLTFPTNEIGRASWRERGESGAGGVP